MTIKINTKFGDLTVLSRVGSNKRGERQWLCACDCGQQKLVKSYNLTNGIVSSCGCKKRGPKRDETLIGQTINKFQILSFSHVNKWRELVYDCKCLRCNKVSKIKRPEIYKMKSCKHCKWDDYESITQGYWQSIKRGAVARNLSFNISIEYAWEVFENQKQKCALSGIDINLCRRWTKNNTASIDRIDNTKGYEIGNIRWVHKELNMLRQAMDNQKFINWCKKVAKFNEHINS